MTVSVTTRFGVYRWSADSDPVARAQFDASNEAIDSLAAKFTAGTSFPTPAATHERSFFLKTDTNILYYFDGVDNTGSWVPVNNFGTTVQGLTFGGSSSAGSSNLAARVDHVHALPDPQLSRFVEKATLDAKGDIYVATANDTVTRLGVGTNDQLLKANSATATGLEWFTPTTVEQKIDKKGDLLVGISNDTAARLESGFNGAILKANSGTTTGLQWSDTLSDLFLTGGSLEESTIRSLKESLSQVASAPTSTININVKTRSVHYYTVNTTTNFTINFRGDNTTTLTSFLGYGSTVSVVVLVKNGSTAYYPTAFTIDGNPVTPRWQGGIAPISGNASSVDAYAFTIVQVSTETYDVFASQTQFA